MPKDEKMWMHHEKNPIWFGVVLFFVGLLWYLRTANYIMTPYFWQFVVMGLGALLVIKGFIKSQMK